MPENNITLASHEKKKKMISLFSGVGGVEYLLLGSFAQTMMSGWEAFVVWLLNSFEEETTM